MTIYKFEDQIIISDKALTIGEELVANTVDAAQEKHVPVAYRDGDAVHVKDGVVEHPSVAAHFITFILLETTTGIHTKWLKPGDKHEASFKLVEGEKPIAVYEHCNLHELWKNDIVATMNSFD